MIPVKVCVSFSKQHVCYVSPATITKLGKETVYIRILNNFKECVVRVIEKPCIKTGYIFLPRYYASLLVCYDTGEVKIEKITIDDKPIDSLLLTMNKGKHEGEEIVRFFDSEEPVIVSKNSSIIIDDESVTFHKYFVVDRTTEIFVRASIIPPKKTTFRCPDFLVSN